MRNECLTYGAAVFWSCLTFYLTKEGCLFPCILLSPVVRLGLYTIMTGAVGVVGFCIFLYRSSFIICTSLALSVGAFLVFLLLEICSEDSGPQRILSGICLFIGFCGPRMGPG